jgi:hypothetical protein
MLASSVIPKGRFAINDLTNAAREVVANASAIQVAGVVIGGGAANEVVIFRSQADGSTVYMTVPVLAGDSKVIPFPWEAPLGLEVITASAAGDVSVTIFYHRP